MLYAKQIEPQYQESPLDFHEMPDDIIVTGNRHYCSHTNDLYDAIVQRYEDAAEAFEALKSGEKQPYKNATEIMRDYFPPADYGRKNYSTQDVHKFKLALEMYGTRAYYENDYIIAMLETLTGEEWCAAEIHGCVQGEWQSVIYPAKYGAEWLQHFEVAYFNLGTEWIVHDGDDVPEDADGIAGYCVYCYTYDAAAELAEIHGISENDVVLYGCY